MIIPFSLKVYKIEFNSYSDYKCTHVVDEDYNVIEFNEVPLLVREDKIDKYKKYGKGIYSLEYVGEILTMDIIGIDKLKEGVESIEETGKKYYKFDLESLGGDNDILDGNAIDNKSSSIFKMYEVTSIDGNTPFVHAEKGNGDKLDIEINSPLIIKEDDINKYMKYGNGIKTLKRVGEMFVEDYYSKLVI